MGVPHMPVRELVSTMSQRIRPAPTFVFGIDGQIYMNAFALDGVESLEDVAPVLRRDPAFFVGIILHADERRRLARHLADGGSEAAGRIAGERRWKKR